MKENLKIKKGYLKTLVLFATFLLIFFFGFAAPVFAVEDDGNDGGGSNQMVANCNNPAAPAYTSERCVKFRLGLDDITDADKIFIARDPNSFFVVGFQVFLWILVIIVTGGIVIDAFVIAGAGNESDKIKEKLISIVWRLVALVLGLGALGITVYVQNFVFGESFNDQVIDCTDLPDSASEDIKLRCLAIIKTTP